MAKIKQKALFRFTPLLYFHLMQWLGSDVWWGRQLLQAGLQMAPTHCTIACWCPAQTMAGWMPHGTFSSPWALTKPVPCILAEDVAWQDLNFGFQELEAQGTKNQRN